MNILLANIYYYPSIGGVENSIRNIANNLVKEGHEVQILSFDSAKYKEISTVDGIKVHRYNFDSSRLPSVVYKNISISAKQALASILKDFIPDQIWTRNTAVALGITQSEYRGTIVHILPTTATLNADGLYGKVTRWGKINLRLIFSQLLKLDDLLFHQRMQLKVLQNPRVYGVVFSSMMKRQILKETGISNIQVVNPGVDTNRFKPLDKLFIEYEMEVAMPFLKSKYVLYVGRISKAKNIDVLISSMQYVPHCNLIIVGEGTYKKELLELVNYKKLYDRVYFIGKQNKYLPIIYARAEATILPTKIETFGQVYLESLACGTPIVGFGNNNCFNNATNEIVIDGYNGTIANEFDSRILGDSIKKILQLVTDKKLQIRENCLETIKNKYAWQNTVEQILNIGSTYE